MKMNLREVKIKFSTFLQDEFKTGDDVKLLMQFLELLVEEYNSNRTKFFEFLSISKNLVSLRKEQTETVVPKTKSFSRQSPPVLNQSATDPDFIVLDNSISTNSHSDNYSHQRSFRQETHPSRNRNPSMSPSSGKFSFVTYEYSNESGVGSGSNSSPTSHHEEDYYHQQSPIKPNNTSFSNVFSNQQQHLGDISSIANEQTINLNIPKSGDPKNKNVTILSFAKLDFLANFGKASSIVAPQKPVLIPSETTNSPRQQFPVDNLKRTIDEVASGSTDSSSSNHSVKRPRKKSYRQASENERLETQQQLSLRDQTIKVCSICKTGPSTPGFNYGAVTCQSCRNFFRHNIYRDDVNDLICKTLSCDTDRYFRTSCVKCKVNHCLFKGMKPKINGI